MHVASSQLFVFLNQRFLWCYPVTFLTLCCPHSESVCSERLKLFGRRRELSREQTCQVFSVLCVWNSRALFSWKKPFKKVFLLWESTQTPQPYSHWNQGNLSIEGTWTSFCLFLKMFHLYLKNSLQFFMTGTSSRTKDNISNSFSLKL